MNIKLNLVANSFSGYDTGGGIRDVKAEITIDSRLHPRVKRHLAIYEALGCALGFCFSHEQLEDLTDLIIDVLDQLEPIEEGGE